MDQEDDSPNEANEASTKRHKNIWKSSLDIVDEDEGEDINADINKDSSNTLNNLVKNESLLQMLVYW